MPKVQSSLKSKIIEICKKYPDYSREEDLYCNVCAHKINFNHTHGANAAKSHLELKLFYAPLNSAAVERSFSIFKYILNERREKLSTESIEKLLILKYNSFL